MAKIGFIGVGVMGAPMARHLINAGHTLHVYNRTTSKAEAFCHTHNALLSPSLYQLGKDADFVIACVGNDDDVRSITKASDGVFSSMHEGSVFIDHTTCSATLAREINTFATGKGIYALDAPVSGGQKGAEQGSLTIMCGGDQPGFDKAKDILAHYSKSCRLMGEAGSGQLTKMVNQICIAGLIEALAEGIQFAEKSGLDINAVLDVISQGAAGSWQMNNRGATMHARKFNFGFAIDLMRKDLGIVFEEAHRNGAVLPVTELVDRFYNELQENGGNRLDTSCLIKRFD